MNKIITTPCTRGTLAVDAALTAFGWLGFFYLVAQGVDTVANGALYHLNHSVVVAIMPVVKTLMVYLTIAAFNALVLVLWASHHKLNSGRRPQRQVVRALPDGNALALRFALSHNELREVQDSQVTIIHLSDNGGITHLETDQLRAEPPDRQGLEHARVA